MTVLSDQFLPLRLGSGDHQNLQRGGKPVKFFLPVVDQRRRAHDQRCPGFFLRVDLIVVGQKDCYGLQGFAQSHVVCQDASESVGVEYAHPPVSDDLVFAQDIPEFCGHIEISVGDRFEFLDQLLKTAVALRVDVLHGLHHLVDIERPESRDVHPAGEQFLW